MQHYVTKLNYINEKALAMRQYDCSTTTVRITDSLGPISGKQVDQRCGYSTYD